MKIYQTIDFFEPPTRAVVTSGTFDGVHLGHQKILRRLNEIKEEIQGESVLITFWPHPRLVLQKDNKDLKLLHTIDEKAKKLEELGIDHFLILPFTADFSSLSPEEFIQKIYIDGINTNRLVIGYDHRFGKNREGGFDYIKDNINRYPFKVEEIPRQDIDSIGISSTKIRNALLEGDIQTANKYLGYPYPLSGTVVHGDKIGRTIGFPTANIYVEESYKLIPGDGIYAVKILYKQKAYKGMLYIGKRPTLTDKEVKLTIEAFIFDFETDIYGQKLEILIIDRVREDKKFDSLEQLQSQMKADQEKTLRILS